MLTNPRHETFAQGIASGLSAVQAYQQAGFSGRSAEANAYRLMENDGVRARIEELRRENEALCVLTRQDALLFLSRVVRTSAAKVKEDESLVQEVGEGGRLRMPCKMAALRQLSAMCGWDRPDTDAPPLSGDLMTQERAAEVMAGMLQRAIVSQ